MRKIKIILEVDPDELDWGKSSAHPRGERPRPPGGSPPGKSTGGNPQPIQQVTG